MNGGDGSAPQPPSGGQRDGAVGRGVWHGSFAGRREVATFLVLTFALSAVFYTLIISADSLTAGSPLYVLGLMWCPGIAALLTRLTFHRTVAGLGWRFGGLDNWALGYALPVVYGGVVYFLVWGTGLGAVDFVVVEEVRGNLLVGLTLGSFSSSLSALGEEIGWRGYLVPRLATSMTLNQTALLSGTVWAVWHWPLILFSDYGAATPVWYSLLCFSVMVVGISFPFAWLTLRSGSVWPAMLMHASHNLYIQGLFDPLTADIGITEYLIGEFGAGLALVGLLFAVVFWRWSGTPARLDR